MPEPSAQRRLKILFCTWNYFPAPAGGAERQARLQAEELVRRGHQVTVVCRRTIPRRRDEIGGVVVLRLPGVRRFLWRTSYLLSLFGFLLRHGRRFDLIHVHLANLQADVAGIAARLIGRPIYVKVACGGPHGEVSRLGRAAFGTRWIGLRTAQRVQALSAEIQAELVGIGVDGRRIVRIPNGIDPVQYSPAGEEEKARLRRELDLPLDAVIVLFAGRFARYKGVEELRAAWRRVRAEWPGSLLVLVGSAADTDSPVESIDEEQQIAVRGWSVGVEDYMRAADIFAYTPLSDGMSNALLEAMACGLAVVASDAGATPELVAHEQGGLLVPPLDERALVGALRRLLADAGLRARLGRAARVEAEGYAVGLVVDAIEAEYLLISKGQRSGA